MPRASFRASPTSSGANRLMVQGLSVATRVGSSPGRRRANSASSRAWRASAQAVRRSNPTIASISCASDKPSACRVSVSISRANNPDGLVLPKVRSSPPWRRSRSISAHANLSSSSVSSSVSSSMSTGATRSSAIASDPHPESNMCSSLSGFHSARKVSERAPPTLGLTVTEFDDQTRFAGTVLAEARHPPQGPAMYPGICICVFQCDKVPCQLHCDADGGTRLGFGDCRPLECGNARSRPTTSPRCAPRSTTATSCPHGRGLLRYSWPDSTYVDFGRG